MFYKALCFIQNELHLSNTRMKRINIRCLHFKANILQNVIAQIFYIRLSYYDKIVHPVRYSFCLRTTRACKICLANTTLASLQQKTKIIWEKRCSQPNTQYAANWKKISLQTGLRGWKILLEICDLLWLHVNVQQLWLLFGIGIGL